VIIAVTCASPIPVPLVTLEISTRMVSLSHPGCPARCQVMVRCAPCGITIEVAEGGNHS